MSDVEHFWDCTNTYPTTPLKELPILFAHTTNTRSLFDAKFSQEFEKFLRKYMFVSAVL